MNRLTGDTPQRLHHEERWLEALGQGRPHWDRGMVDGPRTSAAAFTTHAQAIFEACPLLRSLALRGLDESAAKRLQALPELASIRQLDVRSAKLGEGLGSLVRNPHLASLASLDLSSTKAGPEEILALLDAPMAASLRHLVLQDNPLTLEGLEALLDPDAFPSLETLDLRGTGLTPEGVEMLGESGLVERLHELRLDGFGEGFDGRVGLSTKFGQRALPSTAAAIARATPGGDPEGLSSETPVDEAFDQSVARLVAEHPLTALRVLELRGVGAHTGAALQSAPCATGLRRLSMSHSDVPVKLLAPVPFQALVDFSLRTSKIKIADLRKLLPATWLPTLERLCLAETGLSKTAAAALADIGLERLSSLDLAYNPLGDAGIEALAGSPPLAGLRSLALDGTKCSSRGLEAILQHPDWRSSLRHLGVGNNPRLKAKDAKAILNARFRFLRTLCIDVVGAAEARRMARIRDEVDDGRYDLR